MNAVLEESMPDQVFVLSDRLTPELMMDETEKIEKKKSGYKRLRKNAVEHPAAAAESEVPIFDDGIFDMDGNRPRIQTQKIIKVNADQILRTSSDYDVKIETNQLKK